MKIDKIKELLPDYAYDIKYNFSKVLSTEGASGLTEKEIAAVAVSTAMATPSKKTLGRKARRRV